MGDEKQQAEENKDQKKERMERTQIYIDNIKIKTGKSPEEFKKLAEKKGFMIKGAIKPTVKANEILNWLKEDFELGHGHAMVIYHTLKVKKQ
jgi:hypothetical protein